MHILAGSLKIKDTFLDWVTGLQVYCKIHRPAKINYRRGYLQIHT
jgi:hypothetical protein